MNRIVFDIETLAYPLDTFDGEQQEYLLKFAKTEEERKEALLRLNLTPLTARVLAIGMLNPDTNKGQVLYQGPGDAGGPSEDGNVEFTPCDEKEILMAFWKSIVHYPQFITFNGRSFDCPFLMLRSAVLGVKTTRNLMGYRYESREHCDLLEQFTFYGAVRKFNLDFFCKSFGIKSPKSTGITGLDLGSLFEQGKFRTIAEYCMNDVRATAELFRRWHSFLSFDKSN